MTTQVQMQPVPVTTLPAWNSGRESLRAAILLGKREIRTVSRMPAMLIPSLLVPIFFYFVMVGSLEGFAENFGLENWKAFQLPVSIMFATQSGSAGLNMVADIESGYFDKLLLTPTSRLAILVGAMGADFLRIVVQGTLVVLVGLAFGATIVTGVPGGVLIILICSLWGIAYSAIGFALALKTGNSQTVQSIWTLFIPFMFLTTAFAPKQALSGWLSTAANFNPMTYMLRATRELAMNGWDMTEIGVGLLAVAGLGCLTITLCFLALRSRLR